MASLSLLLVFQAGCPASETIRYAPAVAQATKAFPVTWEGTRVLGAAPARASAQQAAPIGPGPLVAVLEFQSRLPPAEKGLIDGQYLSNAVRSAVKRTRPDARLLTRENIEVILSGNGKSLADCLGECEVQTGRLLGADLIVTGDLLRVGSKLKLDLRMHETKTGQLVGGAAASGQGVDELDGDLGRAVRELTDGLR
jgi:hypothetical protein